MKAKSPLPEDYAKALLARFGLAAVPIAINLHDLADKIGLKVREINPKSFEGTLIRIPNQPIGIVGLKKDVRELGRKRFTLAHEIAHYVLPGHGVTETFCKSDYIESWRKDVPIQETEANRFASELLLPTIHAEKIVHKTTATISTAKTLSVIFQTSLTAAALKCVKVTWEACAVVFSTNGTIRWYWKNDQFRYILQTGEKISHFTIASRLLKKEAERELSGFVPLYVWVEHQSSNSTQEIWEDSIVLPYYNSVLTILTATRS